MGTDPLAQLLAGTLVDPDTNERLTVPTRVVEIRSSLAGSEGSLVAALELGERLAVVSDCTTHAVLGARVERELRGVVRVSSVILPERPHADMQTVSLVGAETRNADALIAVGSGTINDLCKYASARAGKPYAVFGTAPSMNGYTSVNAAITEDGHKKSLPACAAAGVFLDLRVLSGAPPRMIRSGLGDSLCRPTAQADWLLAHLLLDRPYRNIPFALLEADESGLFTAPEALLAGDVAAMQRLARTLVLSGFGMTLSGGSYPASQGEHLISHYVDMLGDAGWPASFHGEQIGVTTLTMARLQQRMLADGPPTLRTTRVSEAQLAQRFGPEVGRSCWHDFAAKCFDSEQVEEINTRLRSNWDGYRRRIGAVLRPAEELEAVLRRAGAPVTHQDLGWPRDFYTAAVKHAREIRDRYTFLDLAVDSGHFDGDALPG